MLPRGRTANGGWSAVYDVVGKDGYPAEWHDTIKHAVREDAGHRCVRCLHPYRRGEHGRGEWTPCDSRCLHVAPDNGPVRLVTLDGSMPPQMVGDDGESYEAGFIRASFNENVGVEAAWRILTVHHLDGCKANCRWWNLVALCQRCHLQIQGKVQMERVYPWPHSDWFRPYVAGYYAWTYLGENISREEAIERMPELLALEQMPA